MNWLSNKVSGLRSLWRFDNRLHLLTNRTLFAQEALTVYRCQGMEILVDHSAADQNGTRECLTTDMYSRYFSKMRLKPGFRVLDLGANGGGFSLSLRANGLEPGRIVCVEMNPQTYLRLHFNVMRNVGAPCQVYNAAVWKEKTTLQVPLGHGGPGESVHQTTAEPGQQMVNVPTMTFDEIAHQCAPEGVIDLAKIDIEGAEFESLMQGPAQSLDRISYILIETHPHRELRQDDLMVYLKQRGFTPLADHQRMHGDCEVHCLRNMALVA